MTLRLWGPHARLGLLVAAATFLLDQAVKTWLIWGYGIAGRQPVALTPFLDLVMAWNLGISYGLFPLDSAAGQMFLALFKVAAATALWLWLCGNEGRVAAAALALIIGGALGNALDRVVYGGVADFFSLHLRAIGSTFHWYVFNLADVAIVAGVGALLYETLLGTRGPAPGEGRRDAKE